MAHSVFLLRATTLINWDFSRILGHFTIKSTCSFTSIIQLYLRIRGSTCQNLDILRLEKKRVVQLIFSCPGFTIRKIHCRTLITVVQLFTVAIKLANGFTFPESFFRCSSNIVEITPASVLIRVFQPRAELVHVRQVSKTWIVRVSFGTDPIDCGLHAGCIG